jgi:hypothetical protein
MKNNFISEHLILRIKSLVKEKQKILGVSDWLYFDEKIKPKTSKSQMWFKDLNRINNYNVYQSEKLLPVSWNNLSPKELLEIHSSLKENRFYSYKNITGKSHKIRIKNKNDKSD